MNVTLQPDIPADLYLETGIAAGTQLIVSLNTSQTVKLSTSEQGLTDDYITASDYKQATNNAGDAGAWAVCHRAAVINVREF